MERRREVLEDQLLTDDLIELIRSIHDLEKLLSVEKHVKVRGMEIDAVLTYLKKRGDQHVRWRIGLELKLMRDFSCNELEKGLKQAIARRPLFTLFYLVVACYDPFRHRMHDRYVLEQFTICSIEDRINTLLKDAYANGVGIIAREDGKYLLLMRSRFVRRDSLLLPLMK